MLKRVVLLALLASMMGTVTSLAADLKPTDKRTYELQQQISYNVIIPSEAFKEAAWNTKHVDTEEELVITIPVSIVMLSGDKPKKK